MVRKERILTSPQYSGQTCEKRLHHDRCRMDKCCVGPVKFVLRRENVDSLYVDMCAYRIVIESEDCTVRFAVKYGPVLDLPVLRLVSWDSDWACGSARRRVTLSQRTSHVLDVYSLD